jgi:alcohol dehydrogenase (cytochrome c)
MKITRAAIALLVSVGPAALAAQIPTDSWPTYHGDYSGRRYSTIKQITTANVKGLALAWVYRLNTSRAGAIVGGEGPDTPPAPDARTGTTPGRRAAAITSATAASASSTSGCTS